MDTPLTFAMLARLRSDGFGPADQETGSPTLKVVTFWESGFEAQGFALITLSAGSCSPPPPPHVNITLNPKSWNARPRPAPAIKKASVPTLTG